MIHKKIIFTALIVLIFGDAHALDDFSPIGYWSYNQCDYESNMLQFRNDGTLQLVVRGEKLFQDGERYTVENETHTIKTPNSKWVFLDINTLKLIKNGKVLERCDLEKSKKEFSEGLNSLKSRKVIKLCSGHDSYARCLFSIKNEKGTIEVELMEKCFWGEFDPTSKLREKGYIHIFRDTDHLRLYSHTLCD